MGRSARPPTARPPSAIGGRTRWIRPTVARRCARCRLTSPRALTSCSSSRRCRGWTSWPPPGLEFDVPIAAYQVSGEYAMIAAAAERGWLDGRRAMTEAVTAIVRAGAGIVITYAAADLATWIAGRAMSEPDVHPGARPRARSGVASPDDAERHEDGCGFRRPSRTSSSTRRPDDQLFVDRAGAGRRPPAVADGAERRRARGVSAPRSCAPGSGGG